MYDTIEKLPVQDAGQANVSELRARSKWQNAAVSLPVLLTLYVGSLDQRQIRWGRRTGLPPVLTLGLVAGLDLLKLTDPRLLAGLNLDVWGFGITGALTYQQVDVGQGQASGFVPSSYQVPQSQEWQPGVFLGVSADASVFETVFSRIFAPPSAKIGAAP